MKPTTYSVVIVDDEARARQHLQALFEDYCPEFNLVSAFENAKDAISHLRTHPVDVVFLDIKMPEMSGLEMLKHFKPNGTKFVFFSAYDDYGVEAIKLGAFDYILKPPRIGDLRNLVARLDDSPAIHHKDLITAVGGKICVPIAHGFKVIEVSSISHIVSDNSYCEVYLVEGGRLVVSKSIKDFQHNLEPVGFFRIHNKYLINLEHLNSFSALDGGFAAMDSGDTLPISRRRLAQFKSQVKRKYSSLG
ncbi:MAG: response regulator [Bacteroidia bacterium]|nr:response regulator [Bacteroidia bacterium]